MKAIIDLDTKFSMIIFAIVFAITKFVRFPMDVLCIEVRDNYYLYQALMDARRNAAVLVVALLTVELVIFGIKKLKKK